MFLYKSELKRRFREFGSLYLLIPSALVLSAILIWLFSGESVLIPAVGNDRGIFPGKFLYAIGYTIRLILSGIITAYTLTDFCRSGVRISSAVVSLLLLTEYKLIFVSIRLFSALVISCVCAALSVYLGIRAGSRGKAVFVFTAIMTVLQMLFCIQLASLILNV